MRIMGVDPGGTSGVVIIDVPWDDNRYEPPPSTLLYDGQLEAVWGTGPDTIGWKLRDIVENYAPELIVIENFTITQRTVRHTRQPDALWIIGGLRFLAATYEIPVHMQQPSLAKNVWDTIRLKDSGWSAAVKQKHARDALRHALTACTTWKPKNN